MSAKRKRNVRVRVDHAQLTVYPWTHPTTGAKRWRYAWKDEGRWRYVTKQTKEEAEDAAEAHLRKMAAGSLVWERLPAARRRFLEDVHRMVTPDDESAVLAFLAARHQSAEIVECVERFVAFKILEDGEERPHLKRVASVLRQMGAHFTGRQVADIQTADLFTWWTDRSQGLSDKRRYHIRAALVQFWKWAQKQRLTGSDPITVAQCLPEVSGSLGNLRVVSVEEMLRLLRAVEPEWRAWVVLGAFGGMRPEEIAPSIDKKKGKRGLYCEEIDWRFGTINVAPETSKVGFPRKIPMSDCLRAWLEWAGIRAGMTGPVCLSNPSDRGETLRLGKVVFGGKWPPDVLRHSYASYRNAVVRGLSQVAEEMGTSVAMMNRHYHNPRAQEEGDAFFALRPGDLEGQQALAAGA